jgi:hypothetical protein
MILNSQESEKIRLHVGIHSGYLHIERDGKNGFIGARGYGQPLRPLPSFEQGIDSAGKAFQYLSSPLMHDLNRMEMMLNTWDEAVHPVPNKELRQLIGAMQRWIETHQEE